MRVRKNAVAFVADTMGIAALHGLLGWLIGETLPLSMISLDYPAHFRRYFFHKALPYPLHLDADRSAICFAAQYLDFPVVRTTHDSGYKLIMSFAPGLEDEGSSANLAERVRRLMYQVLRDSHRVPSLQALSDRLGQTRATLRRQLKQSGVSYNQLKDSCRRELSLDLLRRSQLSIEEIANQLGFCDADAFRRSFRGWIGISPSNYRQQGQARTY
jgi:AraC-like DNA-binding protein